jgi:hypothetical protein
MGTMTSIPFMCRPTLVTKGGLRGSPVIGCDQQAVGLNAGRTKGSIAFFFHWIGWQAQQGF